jgi:hypothetical protein
MRYTSGWVTDRARLALAVAALAVPVTLAAACGPAASQDARATGADAGLGSQSWGTAATPTPAATTPAPDTGGPAQGDSSLTGTVTMQRSGGFAGVMQSVEIAPDGAWTYTDRRAGTVRHGRLSSVQRQRLVRSLADPALTREQAVSAPVGVCSDGYLYQITSDRMRMKFVWCGSVGNRPALVAVITAIEDATPM